MLEWAVSDVERHLGVSVGQGAGNDIEEDGGNRHDGAIEGFRGGGCGYGIRDDAKRCWIILMEIAMMLVKIELKTLDITGPLNAVRLTISVCQHVCFEQR